MRVLELSKELEKVLEAEGDIRIAMFSSYENQKVNAYTLADAYCIEMPYNKNVVLLIPGEAKGLEQFIQMLLRRR